MRTIVIERDAVMPRTRRKCGEIIFEWRFHFLCRFVVLSLVITFKIFVNTSAVDTRLCKLRDTLFVRVKGMGRIQTDIIRTTTVLDMFVFFFFFFFLDPPGDPGKKSLSSIHFRLCTSFRPSAERRLCVNFPPPV